jgi:hypothetical protein
LLLNNWRRHAESWATPNQPIDKYSSAVSFTGWKSETRWKEPAGHKPLPVSPPRTSLLDLDWQWYGLIDPWEVPGRG